MARKEVIQFVDDLDCSPLTEDEVRTVKFSYQGKDYKVDLSETHSQELQEKLRPWLEVATKVKKHRRGAGRPRWDLKDVRRWAESNGYYVPARGRVPNTILDAYDAAHSVSFPA